MRLAKINWESDKIPDAKTNLILVKMQALLGDVAMRELPVGLVQNINLEIEKLNSVGVSELRKALTKSYQIIIKELLDKVKLVPVGYYQTTWMSLGLAVFGVPMGVAFSVSLNNYAYIGIGLPIGMVIGLAVGKRKDEEAKKNGLQLNVNI